MPEVRPSTADLLLAVAAAATVLPAYALARWLWAVQGHPGFRPAAAAFYGNFPLGLRGSAITWASATTAAMAVLASGLVWQRSQRRPRRVIALAILVAAAALLMWNLWSMM